MSYKTPNYTQTPNKFYDFDLREIDTLAELKVTLAVFRKTFGWHKKRDKISLSQLEEITGLTRTSVSSGITKALSRGTIEREADSGSYYYSAVVQSLDQQVQEVDQPSIESGLPSEGEVVEDLDTQKKDNKETTIKKGDEIDGMIAYSKKPIPYQDFPPHIQDYLKPLFKYFPRLRVDNFKNWIKQVEEIAFVYSVAEYEKMCAYANQKGWAVAQPSSVRKAFNMMGSDQQVSWEQDLEAENERRKQLYDQRPD